MSVCIIYHSETGNTRSVAERLAAATGGDLVEVQDLAGYSKAGMYLKGIPRALRGHKADIEPAVIDVSGYDTVVVGTPVWAGNPTPAINAAVAALQGVEGKTAIVFCTSHGAPQKTLETLKTMLAGRGADVQGAVSLTGRDVQDPRAVESLADLVRRSEKEMVVQ
ncbi:MAG TPA: flavodoxin [Candidatus Methanoculleus thermohydrogenotrophicum]|jgi:flavodoxin|nr:flavodoxin [Candidatus Methanoculleus thermohydrogenotrophicum]NLM82845.1 ArsR family transcriptional regulator [Candidatus Methanoculleus thermohydrogenotrophicum]HOB18757.1 flavodoxin [Candidatus Methanoculleus thermohydrogenotrophicum]HPZ38805.1 flavodoxin [Candidatus Methanoculleus thermohydrogenotrophicum]HQC91960.1 flavodoxin [Candidatus Methanoculleus thermohydrogenotrophicum]